MDVWLLLILVGSVWLTGYLAAERGRSRRRWMLFAVVVGPFAIPVLYMADALAAVRKMTSPKQG